MTGEQSGPPGPALARLSIFVGAALLVTVGINKWRELERKATIEEHQKLKPQRQVPKNPATVVHSVVK